MKWPLTTCSEHRESLSLLACGALPEPERAQAEAHLAACPRCRQFCAEVLSLNDQLRAWPREIPPAEASAGFRARWMRSIKAHGSPIEPASPRQTARWREWLWPSPVAWAALAAVWLCILTLRIAVRSPEPASAGVVLTTTRSALGRLPERQRELSALLDSLAAPLSPPPPDVPRPQSRRSHAPIAA